MQKFEGLISAPFTPMNDNGEVLADLIPEYYDFLEKNKVKGAFINGSTGEGVSLSQQERMKVAEKWSRRAKEKKSLKVINLVGGTSYVECIEEAKYSGEIGMDAIALVAPYYFKPDDASMLVDFTGRVAEAVPEMPVFFYHIPSLTGCYISMYDFLQKAAPVIPNLAGIKYTNEDFMDFHSCLNFMDGKYEIFWGRDENLLSALVLGTRAGVKSIAS